MPLMTSNQQIKCHLEKKTSGWKCPTSLPRAARCTDLTLQGRGAAQPRPLVSCHSWGHPGWHQSPPCGLLPQGVSSRPLSSVRAQGTSEHPALRPDHSEHGQRCPTSLPMSQSCRSLSKASPQPLRGLSSCPSLFASGHTQPPAGSRWEVGVGREARCAAPGDSCTPLDGKDQDAVTHSIY